MKIKSFYLERYFSKFEFSAKYLLSSSDCDGLSLDEVLAMADGDDLRTWRDLRLGYTESAGSPTLRKVIAGLYKDVSPDDTVVMTPGEANFIFMNVLLEKGDHVICMAPAYQSLYEVANSIGCKLSFWNPTESEDNHWFYNPDDLEALFTERTKLLVLNFPHNPTGYLPDPVDFSKVLNIAEEHEVFIFSDEMYRMLERDGVATLPPVCECRGNNISLWGMAKTYALAGLRIGWIVCKDRNLLEKILHYKDYLSICNSAPSEVLATIALKHSSALADVNNKKIQSNTSLFEAFCKNHSHIFSFTPPRAGSTAFVRLLTQESALTFSENLVQKTGIMTLPSEMFEFGVKHLRIGFGRKNMPETLAVLDDYLTRNYRVN